MPPSGFGATPGITPTMLNIRPRTPVPRGNIVNPTSHVEQSPRSWNPVRCSPHTPPLLPKPSPLEPVHAWSPRQPPSLHTSPHPRTAPRLLLPRRGHARKLASPLHFPHERGNHPTLEAHVPLRGHVNLPTNPPTLYKEKEFHFPRLSPFPLDHRKYIGTASDIKHPRKGIFCPFSRTSLVLLNIKYIFVKLITKND